MADPSEFPTVEQLLPYAAAIDPEWPKRYAELKEANPWHQKGYFLLMLARHKDEAAFAEHLKNIIKEIADVRPTPDDLREPVAVRLKQGDTGIRWNEKNVATNVAVTLDLVETMEEFGIPTQQFGLSTMVSATRNGYELISIATEVVFPVAKDAPQKNSSRPDLEPDKPDPVKPDAPAPDASKPVAPDPAAFSVPPENKTRYTELTVKFSPQRPVLLAAMAQYPDSRPMAVAIIEAAGRKVDDTLVRIVATGLASFARTGKAPPGTQKSTHPWYLKTVAKMANTTTDALLALQGAPQPARPEPAAEPPVKAGKTPET